MKISQSKGEIYLEKTELLLPAKTDGQPLAEDGVTVLQLVKADRYQVTGQGLNNVVQCRQGMLSRLVFF